MRGKITNRIVRFRNDNTAKFEFIVVTFIIVFSEIVLFRNTGVNNALVDFTYQLENSYRISVGQVPYRDFFLVLTPGIYYLDAFFLKIFNQSNMGQVVLLLLIHLVQILISYFILKGLTSNKKIQWMGTCVIAFSESIFYPFVVYNTASYDMMLLCIFYYLKRKNRNSYTGKNAFMLGILLTLPIYFKQNFGLFFMIAFYFYLITQDVTEKKMQRTIGLFSGTMISGMSFVLFLYLQGVAISQFIFQTLIFPGEAKHPGRVILTNCLAAIEKSIILYGILLLVVALFITYSAFSKKYTQTIALSVVIFAFIIFPYLVRLISGYIPYDNGSINVNSILWYLLYYLIAFIWLKDCLFQNQLFSQKSILILSLFLFIFGIFTKRLDGPSWIWVFAIVLMIEQEVLNNSKPFFIVALMAMLVWNLYSARTVNLTWIDESGKLYQETNISSKFFKIGANGRWIPEIENLSTYIQDVIGEARFVEMPCEDPIYWASLKTPQLDFFQAYPETCPYKMEDFAEIIDNDGIEYIIVKKNCQFKHYMINEDNVNDFIDQISARGYLRIDRFDSYEIYRKE